MNTDRGHNIEEGQFTHNPVLLAEVINYLQPKDGGKYLDCTFGSGGYSRAILTSSNCQVVSLDQDPNVNHFAKQFEEEFSTNFTFIQTNFAEASQKLHNKFDGVVLDLGVSSMQIDDAKRGFSFMKDGPLDMRMNGLGISAENFLASAAEEEIANVIYKYGEEVQSRAIAKKIVEYRKEANIDTTTKLAEIVRDAMHYRKGKIDPATKTFQAIRIFINKELASLEKFLTHVQQLILQGGRIVIVSFHSLEDSIVKNFFKEHAAKKTAQSKYATKVIKAEEGKWLKIITKKPVIPSRDEILQNIRSRSAKLRCAEKIGEEYA